MASVSQPDTSAQTLSEDIGDVDIAAVQVDQGATEPAGAPAHMSVAIDDGEFATTAPASAVDPNPITAETEDSYPELEEHIMLQPPQGFKPYFTLVEDRLTGEHHHPMVHYVFADDDPDLLTNAALETLHTDHVDGAVATDRFVLVDMSADGQEVVSTFSMSADWQGVVSRVTQAPSWGNDSASTQLMLRICGQGSLPGQRARIFQRKKGDVKGLTQILVDLQGDVESVVGSAGNTQ